MGRIELDIFKSGSTTDVRATANKWKFQDVVMGEQFITCTITSEVPIDWEIGDHCEFRGQEYTLNYIPSVTQKGPSNSVLDAYTYENVKLDSFQDELTRCMMLDVTPTTEEYIAVLGTNHTGSSRFQLFCGEITVNGSTLTAVCALALKIQANLDRLYPDAWKVYVDTTTTYTTASGETVLATHTDSKLLTFDNSTVAQAIALVHTEFKLDYCIRGRNIYIGFSIDSIDTNNPITDLTSDEASERFLFGYGKGYPSVENQGKGLFQIKQIANSQQKIVTRLRALGSTKNIPYNYYFKKYGLLSQALFPNNLQLPGTFLPLGTQDDAADADGTTKWSQNNARSQYLRKVLGDTNDSYIDKNDNAAGCIEGIREDCARWDGSNGDLPEIYPTIEGVTFGELRNAGVPDQTGATGQDAYQKGQTKPSGETIQPDDERVDCLLAVGYLDDGVLVDDANIGDGVMPENEVVDTGLHFPVGIGMTKLIYDPLSGQGDSSVYGGIQGQEHELFVVKNVSSGYYFMVPTGPSYSSVSFRFKVSSSTSAAIEVGFVIKVKQKTGSNVTTIATWTSEFDSVDSSAVEHEMFLPEIPDQATTGLVDSIHVTAFSDIIVTFSPLIGRVSPSSVVTLNYMVGRSLSGEYDPEYNWGAVQGGVVSKYPFHVFIKDMGFDLTATFNGETPVMAMKSGQCVGREFEIGENIEKATINGVRGYLLTLNRVEDSNLHIYYPNEHYKLSADDYFVLLNINMPDAYIRAAELRLLKAATEYLADNCETKYTYQPSIDDIYLQRDIDAMALAGTPEKSIFWRLYAGLKFRFNGVPSTPGGPLPLVSMTIEQVTITMGESLTPKVEITLNDEVQQTTLQKLTVAVDRIYNGSAFSSSGAGTSMEAIVNIGNRLFLSKTHDDTATGRISFNDIATFLDLIKAKSGINIGEFLPGFLGSGASIGADGRAEFEEVNVRGAIKAAELVFNQIRAEGGEKIESIGYGEILDVDEASFTATLKLDGDEWATIDVDDICRGLYSTIGKDYDNSDIDETEDTNGFRTKKGFFASYFKIEEVITNTKGECRFRYSLQPGTTEHPCPLMKFAVYGNFNRYDEDSKKARQSSIYTTAVGVSPRILYLAGVNDWKIQPYNIKVAIGNIDGLEVYELIDGAPSLKTLEGDAGLFVEDNIYLGGILNQFTSADWDTIRDELGQGIHAQLLVGSDNIVVDALGNVVGGLVIENTDGTTVTRQYKLHTGVLVYDSGKERYLTVGDSENLQDGEFAMFVSANGCTIMRDGADVYITAIDNTANGSALSDAQLEAMRDTDGFSVDFTIVTSNGWRTQMSYPVKITHLDQAYITFDLTNEMDSMSYSSQLKRYLGLPVTTSIKAYVNGSEVSDFVSVSMESSAFSGKKTTDSAAHPATAYFGDDSLSGLQASLSLDGTLAIRQGDGAIQDLSDAKYWFDLSCVVKYAGVNYTSPLKRFVVQETTDSTLYKLLLSANAVSKSEGVYTPSTIDISVQVIDTGGTHIFTAAEMNAGGNVKVRYVNGVYGESPVLSTMPQFDQIPTCLTVVLQDESDSSNPIVLDIESVPMTAVGSNGAGQPWVKSNYESIFIDCTSDGRVDGTQSVRISGNLYWGDTICELDTSSGACLIQAENEISDSPDSVTSQAAYKDYTFADGDNFNTTYISVYLIGEDPQEHEQHTAIKSIPVVANKKGTKGDTGDAGAAVRFRGEYSQDTDFNTGYVWNSYFRDCVKDGSAYYLVKIHSDGSSPLGKPSGSGGAKWENIGEMRFVATELLLAENGVIDLLYSNIIKMRDASGNITATFNEDQNGSYRIYYKGGTNIRMEFSYEGFIRYRNDDAENSIAWTLGHGGDIHKGNSDDWQLFPLHKLTSEELSSLDSNSRFGLTDYWRFVAGSSGQWSAYSGSLYLTVPNDRNPSNGLFVEEGYYTPNYIPFADDETMSETSVPAITLYTVAAVDDKVKIVQTRIFKQGDTIE